MDGISGAEANRVLGTLRELYIGGAHLSTDEVGRATLEGIVLRQRPGIDLVRGGSDRRRPARRALHSETLGGCALYLRLGTLDEAKLTEIDRALRDVPWAEITGVILDLRAGDPEGSGELVAELLERFVPPDRPLFKATRPAGKGERVFQSKRQPSARGLVLVLVDGDVRGPIEIAAAALRAAAGAIVIGTPTRGETAEFSELTLPGNTILRIAVAELVLGDGSVRFGEGIRVDIEVPMASADKWRIVDESGAGGVARFVEERERPRLNEAALIAGVNPELAVQSELPEGEHRGAEERKELVDPVIQRAVDIASAIGVLGPGAPAVDSSSPSPE